MFTNYVPSAAVTATPAGLRRRALVSKTGGGFRRSLFSALFVTVTIVPWSLDYKKDSG